MGVWNQELSNPYVNKHLKFYPHDSEGKNIRALYQCAKWREHLSPDLRVQMVCVEGKDYYIFEPANLKSSVWDALHGEQTDVVIPVYFYWFQNEIYAKCINPKIQGQSRHNPKGLSLFIPGNLSYQSSRLLSIKTKNFRYNYLETKLEDGMLLSESCNHQIIGQYF